MLKILARNTICQLKHMLRWPKKPALKIKPALVKPINATANV